MLHQSSPKSNRYQEQKQGRLEQAIATLTIGSDPWGIFSVVPSTSKRLEVYVVNIEDGKAVKCQCKGYEHGYQCIHIQATQIYIDALVEDAAATVSIAEAMEEAQSEMEQHIETVAAQAERENMQKLTEHKMSDAYDILGPTKKVTRAAYGTCGHLVKPGHEEHMCGGCYQKSCM